MFNRDENLFDKYRSQENDLKPITEASESVYASPKEEWVDGYWFGLWIMLFGLAVALLAFRLISKGNDAQQILKVFGILLIITLGAFLVIAGYSETQISPAIGLLGTIAGYLLGKTDKRSENTDE